MSLKCQNCGEELPDFPKDEVESANGQIDEVVQHSVRKKEGAGWASTLTDYYCNSECFIEAKGDTE
jgi:hypothetical protein